MKILRGLILIVLINIKYLVVHAAASSDNFEGDILRDSLRCNLVSNGSSTGMALYASARNICFRSKNGNVITTKIGSSSSINLSISYCECYQQSGACRISLTGQDNNYHYKLIIGLILENRKVVLPITSFDIFRNLKKDKKIRNYDYCNVVNDMVLSSFYTYKDGKYDAWGYGPRFSRPKDIVTGSLEKTFRFPLIYYAEADYGKQKNGVNGKEHIMTIVGDFRIDSVVECSSKVNTFSSTVINNKYMRSDHDPYSEYKPCTWGKKFSTAQYKK